MATGLVTSENTCPLVNVVGQEWYRFMIGKPEKQANPTGQLVEKFY